MKQIPEIRCGGSALNEWYRLHVREPFSGSRADWVRGRAVRAGQRPQPEGAIESLRADSDWLAWITHMSMEAARSMSLSRGE